MANATEKETTNKGPHATGNVDVNATVYSNDNCNCKCLSREDLCLLNVSNALRTVHDEFVDANRPPMIRVIL